MNGEFEIGEYATGAFSVYTLFCQFQKFSNMTPKHSIGNKILIISDWPKRICRQPIKDLKDSRIKQPQRCSFKDEISDLIMHNKVEHIKNQFQ